MSDKKPAYRALDAMLGEHWLMLPDRLDQMAQIALRENGDPEALAAKLGRPLDNTRSVSVRDGVAIVPISGPIMRRANLFTEISGATSLQMLASDLYAADADPQVRAIVLDIDSPGGQAAGIADMATIVAAIDKPVIAYVDNQAASAAYWIAAAADEIVISRAAMLGSVGVIVTANTKQQDGTVQIISTQSPRKRPDMSTETGRAQVQALVDDLADVFVSDVAQLRGISIEDVLSWEGDMLVGSKAVDAGMADRLGDIESIIAGLSGSLQRNHNMSTNHAASSPGVTRESIVADHPAIADALRAEGRDALLADTDALLAVPAVAAAVAAKSVAAATAERERIQSVEAQGAALPGFAELVNKLKFDGVTTGPEAAVQLLAANGEKMKSARATLSAEAPTPLAPVAEQQPIEIDQNAPVEDRCKAQWDRDPEIRSEFGSLSAYTAYIKAEESGRIRRIGGKS